jgi:subtilisin family serine protease
VGAVSPAYAKGTHTESASYGEGIDLVAYSGNGNTGYADVGGFGGTDWDQPLFYPRSGLSLPTFWTLGWHGVPEYTAPGFTEGNTTFAGNFVNRVEGQRIYGIIPQPALTSGATPQVAGVAALLFSYRPELTPPQVISMLLRGCRNIDKYNTNQCGGGPCAGKLGAGALDAYRAMTLWGAVGDTTLSGDVYVSGDVWIKPGATVTCAVGTRLFVAPDDVYEGDIVDAGAPGGVNCYQWLAINKTGFTNVPAATSPPKIEIYVSGTFDNRLAVMYGWRDSPTPATWSGIYVQDTGTVLEGGSSRVRDSASGVVEDAQ